MSFFFTVPRVLPCGVFHSTSSPCLNSSWDTTGLLSWRLPSVDSNLSYASRRLKWLCLQVLIAANKRLLFPTRSLRLIPFSLNVGVNINRKTSNVHARFTPAEYKGRVASSEGEQEGTLWFSREKLATWTPKKPRGCSE